MPRAGDEYVTVEAALKQYTARAVLLDVGDAVSRGAWVPRSCLHFTSDKQVETLELDARAEWRVREWVAEREGLI